LNLDFADRRPGSEGWPHTLRPKDTDLGERWGVTLRVTAFHFDFFHFYYILQKMVVKTMMIGLLFVASLHSTIAWDPANGDCKFI
jgi:hypothetical protein